MTKLYRKRRGLPRPRRFAILGPPNVVRFGLRQSSGALVTDATRTLPLPPRPIHCTASKNAFCERSDDRAFERAPIRIRIKSPSTYPPPDRSPATDCSRTFAINSTSRRGARDRNTTRKLPQAEIVSANSPRREGRSASFSCSSKVLSLPTTAAPQTSPAQPAHSRMWLSRSTLGTHAARCPARGNSYASLFWLLASTRAFRTHAIMIVAARMRHSRRRSRMPGQLAAFLRVRLVFANLSLCAR